MKNREVWASYDYYTGEITKHSRYSGFAGIAICWFFRTPEVTFPPLILAALIGLVAFFLLDLAQYYVAALRLRFWMHREEAKVERGGGSVDAEYWLPKSLDSPSFWLFHAKLASIVVGFLLIGAELAQRFS